MKFEVFTDHTTIPEVGFVMPNHVASSLDGTLGDRARYVNELTGYLVFALERTGTASLPQRKPFTVDEYVEDVARRAELIQHELKERGIEKTILGHDSAGATDALVLAASGIIKNIERVISIDPASLKKEPDNNRSIIRWIQALRSSEKGFDLEEFKDLPELKSFNKPSNRDIVSLAYKEIKTYRTVYTSDIGKIMLRKLADSGVPVDLIISEHNYTAPSEVQNELVEDFNKSSVNVQIFPGAHHGFVEPSSHLLHVIQKVLASANEPEKTLP